MFSQEIMKEFKNCNTKSSYNMAASEGFNGDLQSFSDAADKQMSEENVKNIYKQNEYYGD